MTKKEMRNLLDIQLSAQLVVDSVEGYSSLLLFAFFTDLISGSEFKRLRRVAFCFGGLPYVVSF